ncbi:hypothetical protein RND71_034475 [Anisodus tanguticus]|uniref:Uncharacterized protein n=1 Tax=Anisodus tanguticus TaxID=243964 RepID=A0AAE1RA95_9SOLA|nr:hypothetical protein RND71_034475 [Anisodus tanguticus]
MTGGMWYCNYWLVSLQSSYFYLTSIFLYTNSAFLWSIIRNQAEVGFSLSIYNICKLAPSQVSVGFGLVDFPKNDSYSIHHVFMYPVSALLFSKTSRTILSDCPLPPGFALGFANQPGMFQPRCLDDDVVVVVL